MTPHDLIRHNLNMCHGLLTSYIADLAEADLMVRPLPNMNHIAWQLGHLIGSEHELVSAAIPGSMPALPPGFAERHDKAAAASNDRSKFLSKKEYLELFEIQRAATLAQLDKLSAADLDRPGPEKYRDFIPTVGAALHMQGSHEMMHAGQFVAVRRALGKPAMF